MRIAFFAENCIPIHARSLEERPLGGTETALIRLAEVLDARGHEVSVFTSMKNPPESKPRYLHSPQVLRSGRFDIMVLVQDWSPAVRGVEAGKVFYWTGDGPEQYATYGIGDARAVKKIDCLLAVSSWQAEVLSQSSGFPREKIRIIGNGAHLPYFEGEEERRRKRLIYTAAPYRGLALVPAIYQALKQKHPECELHLFSGFSIYDREQSFSGPLVGQFQELKKRLSTLPDCTLHENVSQSNLARELMKSSVFIYPNIIFETCCITAIEAQAAGCPVVASATSALPETVGDGGIVVPGEPGSMPYLQAFASSVDSLLSDDSLWKEYSLRAKERARGIFSWNNVADKFEALL